MARLGDLGRIITGNTPKTSDAKNYEAKDICFVKPSDIDEHELTYIKNSECYIAEYARGKARIVPIGSVLVTCIGIIGKVGINDVECAFNQQINAVIPNTSICNNKYLAYAILSSKSRLEHIANAPVVPILNKSQFSDIEIPLPSLDEQRKIAAVLDKISDLTAKRRRQLDKLDELVQSRFIEMFGTYPANERAWQTCTIRDVVSDVRYGSSRPAVDGGAYPYLRMNNITYAGELDLSDVKRIDVPESELSRCIVRRGDVLFNRTNSKELVGKTCVYDRDEMMVLAGFVIRVRVNDKILPEFLSTFLNADFSKQMLLGKCKTAIGQANINANEMQSIGIYLPPLELQSRFVEVQQQTRKLKSTIRRSLTTLETLKKSLMQEYFSVR